MRIQPLLFVKYSIVFCSLFLTGCFDFFGDGKSKSEVSEQFRPSIAVPRTEDFNFATSMNTPYSAWLLAKDTSGGSLTYSIVESSTKGEVKITNASTGAFTYTPAHGQSGDDAFTFSASNGAFTSRVALVKIHIVNTGFALSANYSSGNVQLSWTAPDGAISYKIMRGTSSGSYPTTLAIGVSTANYTDSTATAGTSYYYKVEALNSLGGYEPSSETVIRPIASFAVGAVTATAAEALNVNWSAVAGASNYTVRYSSVSSSASSGTVACSGITGTSCAVSGLTAGTTYYFSVSAANSVGMGSNIFSTNEGNGVPLGNFSITGKVNNATSPSVVWANSTGASSYVVKYGTTSGAYGSTASSCNANDCTISGLTDGTTYYFMVYAVNASGQAPAAIEVAIRGISSFTTSSVSLTTTNTLNVGWSAVTGAATYTVRYSTTSGAAATGTVACSAIATTSCSVGSLTAGTTYYFSVEAHNSVGLGFSRFAAAEVSGVPLGSFSITGKVSGAVLPSLTWGSSSGATSYQVKYGTTSGTYGTTASGCNTNDCTVSGLTDGTTYYYMVYASNTNGTIEASAEVSIRGIEAFSISSVTAPATGALTVNWPAVSGAASYTVRSSTTLAGAITGSVVSGCSAITATSCALTGLTAGTTYYFSVAAANTVGLGFTQLSSNEGSGVPMGSFSISANTAGSTSAALTWGSSTGASSYELKYGTVSGTYGSTASGCAANSCTVSGLTNGTTYYFMVYAVNANGSIPASANSSSTPPGALSIAFTGPSGANTGKCSTAVTITAKDGRGTAYTVPSAVAVSLTSDIGFYYSDSACAVKVTTATISSGASTATVYAKSNLAETFTLTGTATGYTTTSLDVANTLNMTRIDLFAGQYEGSGSADGIGTDARFNGPVGVQLVDGALWVVDGFNHRIKSVNLTTLQSTLIVGGTMGFLDGTGTAARINTPRGILYDGTKYVYISDSSNARIRRIDKDTLAVTTVAGSGSQGSADGVGNAATFNGPRAMYLLNNYLYVSEIGSHNIRRIDVTPGGTYGTVTTIAGTGAASFANGTGTAAAFNTPVGMTGDGTYLYIADQGNNRIRRLQISNNAVTTFIGNGTNVDNPGNSTTATFSNPLSVQYDNGNLYVVSGGGASIYKVVVSTVISTNLAGSAISYYLGDSNGIGLNARMINGYGALFVDNGYLYVADIRTFSVKRLKLSNNEMETVVGRAPIIKSVDNANPLNAYVNVPRGMVLVGREIFFTDTNSFTIRKMSLITGEITTVAGSNGNQGTINGVGTAARFQAPRDLCYDGSNIYIADYAANTIKKMTLNDYTVTTVAGTAGTTGGTDGDSATSRLNGPSGIYCRDGLSGVFFTDVGGHTIRKLDVANNNIVSTISGLYNTAGFVNGNASTSRYRAPVQLTGVGAYLYVADLNNYAIRRVEIATGNSITLAGTTSGFLDGSLSTARLGSPNAVTTDGNGIFYIQDVNNQRIRKIDVAGDAMSTFAGSASTIEADGVLPGSIGLLGNQGTVLWTPHGVFITNMHGIRWIH